MMLLNLVHFFREERTYWRILRELSTYTDRELLDLGIGDIHEVARLGAKEMKV